MNSNRKRAWLVGGLALALAAGLIVPFGIPTSVPNALAQDDEAPLEDIMGTISSRHKRLRRTIPDAAMNQTSLKYLLEMQTACVEAKKYPPSKAAKVPESQRSKFVNAYKKGINQLISQLIVIENALLDGDQKAAQASYAKLLEIKKASHDKFIEQ